jgi:hypothetical protein
VNIFLVQMARFIFTLTRREASQIHLRERIEGLQYQRGRGLRRHIAELNELVRQLEAQQFPVLDNYKIYALHKSVPSFIGELITKIFQECGERISYPNLVEELFRQVDDMAIRPGGTAAAIPVHEIEDDPTPSVASDNDGIDESRSDRNWKMMYYGLGFLVVIVGVAICYYV